jgi:crossover junction endodeoxyribonuclease RuvC
MTSELAESIFMGVDPGLTATGWGIVRKTGRKISYVDSGKIPSRSSQRMGARLKHIFDQLREIAEKYQVEYCAVESGYVGKSAQSALKLGQARAAAVLALELTGVAVQDISPREVKQAITGRGSAAKEQVGYMVERMLGIKFDKGEEDISDALAVALCVALNSVRDKRLAAAI